jgi:hypothetical protein
LQCLDDHAAGALGELATGVFGARLVVGHGKQRDHGRLGRCPDRGSPVLIVEIEANQRLDPIAQRLQQLTLAGLQVQRVAIDVDALGVAPLEAFGTVRVEHRHDMEGQVRE